MIYIVQVLGLWWAVMTTTPMGPDAATSAIFSGDGSVRANRLVVESLAHQLQPSVNQPRIVCGDSYALIQGIDQPPEYGADCHANAPWTADYDVLGWGR